jgi:DNA repair photolyase
VVKVNVVERLRAGLAARHWAGHHIAMGTNTDPYQRCEGKYHLTQGVVRKLTEARNPFSILTKSALILRDLDLLARAAARADVTVNLSIGTLDDDVWRCTEPGTPPPRRRVEAVRRLNQAGVRGGVLVAPVLPGLSDHPAQTEEVVAASVGAGAASVSTVALHLRPGEREHYLSWLERNRPDLVGEMKRRYRTAYLPAAQQRALSDQVAALVRDARRAGQAQTGPDQDIPVGADSYGHPRRATSSGDIAGQLSQRRRRRSCGLAPEAGGRYCSVSSSACRRATTRWSMTCPGSPVVSPTVPARRADRHAMARRVAMSSSDRRPGPSRASGTSGETTLESSLRARVTIAVARPSASGVTSIISLCWAQAPRPTSTHFATGLWGAL